MNRPSFLAARRTLRAARSVAAAELAAADWVPVVDVSEHQGDIDFRTMRDRGVRGLVLRACHGLDVDDRVHAYYAGARAAGYEANEIGFYPFLNPKRGDARSCAEVLCKAALAAADGDPIPFTMIDVESYLSEPPRKGQLEWPAGPVHQAGYAQWIRDHQAVTAEILPASHRIGYTNAAYWNPNVGDPALAGSLDWFVPRYVVYTPVGYILHPLPEHAAGWPDWCAYWLRRGKAPLPPEGAEWAAWQFSAGWNRQGARYGASSTHLDLNIVRAEDWARWTSPLELPPIITNPPTLSEEDDMPAKLIKVRGDAAVFAEHGLGAVWGRSAEHIAEKQGTGAWAAGPVVEVSRGYLKTLRLVGDEPSYEGVDPSQTGRTTRADFAPEAPAPPVVLAGQVTVAGRLDIAD